MAYTQSEIEKIKAEAKEYTGYVYNIDGMVKKFAECKARGENVFYNFNGHKCYSLLDNEDSCYKKITGYTKSEYDEAQKKWHEEYTKREAEEKKKAQDKIPGWTAEGKKYIYAEKADKWNECVKIRAGDLYHGADLENALEVMKHLDKGGDLAEAKRMIDEQGHSGASYGIVMSILVSFSKRGPELYRFMEKDHLSPQNEEYLKKVEEENRQFEQNQKASQPGSGNN